MGLGAKRTRSILFLLQRYSLACISSSFRYSYICKVKKIVFNQLLTLQLNDTLLSKWLDDCAHYYGVTIQQLHYSFVSKERMLKLNQTHLDHDTHTDIITFDYGDCTSISAEIYISSDQCEENAHTFNVSIENEILRLISHGFLHCIGYNDKNEEEKNQMREEENHCIELFHVKHRENV